jgi:hypothetical protein
MKKQTTKVGQVRNAHSRNGKFGNTLEETLAVVNITSGKVFQAGNDSNVKRRVEVKERVERTREFGVERSLIIEVDGVKFELLLAGEKLVMTLDAFTPGYEKSTMMNDRIVLTPKK